jgi:hypothetical protein
MKCQHCKHEGSKDDPVIYRTVYVGGRGDVTVAECQDRGRCWKRIDRANGLTELLMHLPERADRVAGWPHSI